MARRPVAFTSIPTPVGTPHQWAFRVLEHWHAPDEVLASGTLQMDLQGRVESVEFTDNVIPGGHGYTGEITEETVLQGWEETR